MSHNGKEVKKRQRNVHVEHSPAKMNDKVCRYITLFGPFFPKADLGFKGLWCMKGQGSIFRFLFYVTYYVPFLFFNITVLKHGWQGTIACRYCSITWSQLQYSQFDPEFVLMSVWRFCFCINVII